MYGCVSELFYNSTWDNVKNRRLLYEARYDVFSQCCMYVPLHYTYVYKSISIYAFFYRGSSSVILCSFAPLQISFSLTCGITYSSSRILFPYRHNLSLVSLAYIYIYLYTILHIHWLIYTFLYTILPTSDNICSFARTKLVKKRKIYFSAR